MFKLKMLMLGIVGQMEPEKGAGGAGGKGKATPKPKPDPKPKAEDPAPEDGDDEEEEDDEEGEEEEDDGEGEEEEDDDADAAREQIERLRAKNKELKDKLKGKGDADPQPAPKGAEGEAARRLAKLQAENDRLKREASERKAREQIAAKLATEGVNGALVALLSAGLMALAVDEDGELDSFEVSGQIKALKKSLPQLFGAAAAKPKAKTTASPDTGKGKGSDDKPKPKKGEPTAKELADAARAQSKGKKGRWL